MATAEVLTERSAILVSSASSTESATLLENSNLSSASLLSFPSKAYLPGHSSWVPTAISGVSTWRCAFRRRSKPRSAMILTAGNYHAVSFSSQLRLKKRERRGEFLFLLSCLSQTHHNQCPSADPFWLGTLISPYYWGGSNGMCLVNKWSLLKLWILGQTTVVANSQKCTVSIYHPSGLLKCNDSATGRAAGALTPMCMNLKKKKKP